MKRLFLLIIIFLFLITNYLFAHVKHYDKVKYLKYNLFLNNEQIGFHSLDFKKKNDIMEVIGSGSFKVSKLGIDLIKYTTNTQAIYKENQLIQFNSKTIQNDKVKFVKIKLEGKSLDIDGSSYKGKTDSDTMVSSLWNHAIVLKNKQISSISGRIIDQKVRFLGKKKININNKVFETLNFHIFSNDNKPMNKKKINIKIWYDIDTLIWVKASYEKMGHWEYRIKEIKY